METRRVKFSFYAEVNIDVEIGLKREELYNVLDQVRDALVIHAPSYLNISPLVENVFIDVSWDDDINTDDYDFDLKKEEE